MKMKLGSILTAAIFILSQGMTVCAAMPSSTSEPFMAQNYNARATITYQGDSYTTTQEGIQCRCSVTNQTVTAGTDKSNSTVTVSSKSYNSMNATGTNGSNGGAAANTVTVTYTATSTIKYTYQEHSVPYYATIPIMLIRQ